MNRVRLCGAKVGDVNDAFDRVLSGFAPAAGRPAADSAPISAEPSRAPPEPQRPRAQAAADRTGPSHFHDVDSREDVDDLRRGVDSMLSPFGIVAGAVACWAVSGVAMAQEAPTQAKDPQSLQELAKTHKNPFTQSVNVPFEFATGFGVGSERRTGESMNIQPVLPFSLTSGWTLIALPSLSVTYEPPADEAFGLQDLQLSPILTPTQADRWIWGIGPIFLSPRRAAASSEAAPQERCAATSGG